ncbi:PepSY-associated TM helix domain-containing protein [Wenzhouxiangella sediminis]|uniref:PepSY domain-containing protein n=1 Tax=Wenzhouxiangella sediminis TaxID=1792836 RepID=A0A3E1K7M6_9GAMM|nr:PepSY-associated TM helix domain-containing protein [Wenzhouxiangella sediminis]RFF29997.1 PepSY domain-containing protein [Wenzhouxiangella sediminis]
MNLKWSRLPSGLVSSMLSGHLTLGLAASALLYILCLTGTAMVFHEEFARWEQPQVPEMDSVAPAAAARAAQSVLSELEEAPHHFYVGLPTPTNPRLWVATSERTWFADSQGSIVVEADHEWAHFLEKIHYYLTLPTLPGLTLVGILGVLMAGLCLSGLLAHPRLFRDAFRLRLKSSRRLVQADLHNRLSVWAFPFHLVIALTGAALGLSLLVAAVFAPVVNDGETATFFDPIFGSEVEGADTPAPLADIEAALVNFERAHPDVRAWVISFHDPATEGQSAEILAYHPRRLIFGDYVGFDAAGRLGEWTGLSDGEIGQQVVASLYPLHFGSFGGLPVKILYGLLGLAACSVVATGLNIWLVKRRQSGRPVPAFERAWTATVWGAPLALSAVALADLAVTRELPWLIALFWTLQLGLIALAMTIPGLIGKRRLLWATTAVLLLTLGWHSPDLVTGPANPAAWGVSLALLAAAVILGRMGLRESGRAGDDRVSGSGA